MILATLVLALSISALAFAAGPLRGLARFERWVIAASSAVALLALCSWASVRLGHYSPWIVDVGLVTISVVAWRIALRRAVAQCSAPTARGGELALVALSGLGALYAFYPTYFLLGGQDPGVYLLLGRWIARTGGTDVNTAWSHAAASATNGALALGYPALGTGADPTRLVPQFMHLFPALEANAWAAGGLEAAVRVNAFIALLALGVLFVLCRRLLGSKPALGVVLALGLNPAFIWGARITLTEILALWLNLTGLLLLLVARETTSTAWGRAAGAILGAGVLNRLDAGFSTLGVLGFALATASESRLRPAARAAAVACLVTSGIGYLDGRFSTTPYFLDLISRHSLGVAIGLTFAVCVLAWCLAAENARWLERLRLETRNVRLVGAVGVFLLAGWLAFALFFRPRFSTTGNALAARELTWYVTPIAWPLFMAGLALALRAETWKRWLPLVLLACGSVFIYTFRTDVAHEHLWASRRWLPQVIPLVIVFSASTLAWLFEQKGPLRYATRALAAAACCAYGALALDFAQPFLFRSMLADLPGAYERLSAFVKHSGTKTPLVTGNVQLASILTYLYDTPTMLTVNAGSSSLTRHELAGFAAVGFGAFELGDVTDYSDPFLGRHLEITSDHPPRQLVDMPLLFSVGRIGGPTYEVEVPAAHPSLGTLVGRRDEGGNMHTTGRAGTLQNGPWMSITAGQYEVDWLGRVWQAPADKPCGSLDVIVDGGKRVLGNADLRVRPGSGGETWLGGVDFGVEQPLSGVEFRMQVSSDAGLVLTRVRLRRVAVP